MAARTGREAAAEPGAGRSLEEHLGAAIRAQRQREGLTIAEVARRAGISAGMLSKMENGQTSTSLDTLSAVAKALGATLANLFRGWDAPQGGAQHVKKGEGMEVVRRGTKKGHTYHLLAYDQGPRKVFEPFLITMNDESEVFPTFEHPGTEFIHILEGKLRYRHGQQTYVLNPGDSISFKGSVPHGPEELIKLPIRMLCLIIYSDDGEKPAR